MLAGLNSEPEARLRYIGSTFSDNSEILQLKISAKQAYLTKVTIFCEADDPDVTYTFLTSDSTISNIKMGNKASFE